MVKAIVIYNSRGGNTKKVAEQIAKGLEVDCIDYKNIPKNIENYDFIVLGTWPMMFKVRGAGRKYLKKLGKKNLAGKKVVLFFTSAGPDELVPKSEEQGNPKLIKEMVYETMAELVNAGKNVNILEERFYCKGALRMFGKIMDNEGHPTNEELEKALQFGEMLKEKYLS